MYDHRKKKVVIGFVLNIQYIISGESLQCKGKISAEHIQPSWVTLEPILQILAEDFEFASTQR
jgi:hypothetical protein